MHIKRELILTELAARRYESGGAGPQIKKKYRDLIERRMRLKRRLKENKITLVSYLEARTN